MKKDYDSTPVYYCAECKSLYILRSKIGRGNVDYCGKCGNTAIVKTDINKYLKLFGDGKQGNES